MLQAITDYRKENGVKKKMNKDGVFKRKEERKYRTQTIKRQVK